MDVVRGCCGDDGRGSRSYRASVGGSCWGRIGNGCRDGYRDLDVGLFGLDRRMDLTVGSSHHERGRDWYNDLPDERFVIVFVIKSGLINIVIVAILVLGYIVFILKLLVFFLFRVLVFS